MNIKYNILGFNKIKYYICILLIKNYNMLVELDRKALETLVKGSRPYYGFENDLVKKAGYFYNEQYSSSGTYWYNLKNLTDEELYELYKICRDSWN